MTISQKRLLNVYQKRPVDRIPFWFMRQAGRYLPEYKALRATTKGFLDFCYTPGKASEATLQPIARFDMDGAIIFSDILVVPHALGAKVTFEEGRGPIVVPIRTQKELDTLSTNRFSAHLEPVYEALRITRKSLPDDKTLIGFCGAPWTLACYIIEGGSSRDFSMVKQTAVSDPVFFDRLMELLGRAVAAHAIRQIESGAEVIQIFDSWAGIVPDEYFDRWCIAPMKQIVQAIRAVHPEVPIIGFPRQCGERMQRYAQDTNINAINVDHSVSMEYVRHHIQPHCVAQGCLDPILLADDKEAMLAQAREILSTFDKPFVFNLSHGILPHTPIEHVQALCDVLKQA